MDFVMPVRVSNRKHFTTDQKHAMLDEYDKCLEWGSKAAFIRAAGITEGTMNRWCRAAGVRGAEVQIRQPRGGPAIERGR